MSRLTISTPDTTRQDSKSALDFTYWVIDTATEFYTSNMAALDFEGLAAYEQASVDLVRFAAAQVGIDLPPNLDGIISAIRTEETTEDPERCFRLRGSLLFRERGIAVCLGDGKRLVETQGLSVIVRYITALERQPDFWSMGARVPGMVYL